MKTRSAMLVALVLGVSALNSAAQEGWAIFGGGEPPATVRFGPGARVRHNASSSTAGLPGAQGDFGPARRNFDWPVRAQAQRDGFDRAARTGPMGPPRFEGGRPFGPGEELGRVSRAGARRRDSLAPGFGPRRFDLTDGATAFRRPRPGPWRNWPMRQQAAPGGQGFGPPGFASTSPPARFLRT